MNKLWIFDFDGTLVDSEKTIKSCYQKVSQDLIPERCNFIKNMVIGATLDESSKIILTNDNIHLLDEFKNRFQMLYDEKIILETQPYPNVHSTLIQLHSQGDHLCIVTNKRSYPTHKLINYYKWDLLFDWVCCMDEYPEVKNKSDLLSIKNINLNNYEKTFFVGDTLSDGEAANFHNILFIKANYGYGGNQKWKKIAVNKTINNFEEILSI